MEQGEALQLIDGELKTIEESCVTHAVKTFSSRKEQDTNQQIVQMILCGEPIPHWYYRSDQWIDQPYFISPLVQPYVGPTDGMVPPAYWEGRYNVEENFTEVLSQGADEFIVKSLEGKLLNGLFP